jgi:hypothetical protein
LTKINEKQKLCLSTPRALHQQLDDDKDGTIEPSETGDFIKGDLKVRTGNVSDRLLALETQGCTQHALDTGFGYFLEEPLLF